jgi:hypothetical protein
MELAVIIATIFVVILQIITIAKVSSLKKTVSDQGEKIGQLVSSAEKAQQERKDRDFRNQNNRRPGNDNRPPRTNQPQSQQAQPSAPGTVDTVEKSLRDINLKLKNAERDQEFARRKVQENLSKDQNQNPNQNQNRRDNRDNRGDRGDRRGGNRDRDHRHGGGSERNRDNRDRRNNNWQERNKSREPINFDAPAGSSEENTSLENQNVMIQDQAQSQVQEPIQNTSEPIESASTSDIAQDDNDENLQHGRKILVKRRMLKEGDTGEGSETESGSGESTPPDPSSEASGDAEIKFGRR